MICPECSNNVPEGFTVCPHCGLSMKSINEIQQRQAFREAQARVRGDAQVPVMNGGAVSSRIRQRPKKKTFGVPKTADYIRMVCAVATFILMCISWYSIKIPSGGGSSVYHNTIFGPGRGGIFVVPAVFGILSIVLLLLMITNTFLNFGKLIPALGKINTLRLISMLYTAVYVMAEFFAIVAVIFTNIPGITYSLTVWFVIAVFVSALLAYLTFTPVLDRRFRK